MHALAHLFGFELLTRIRNWEALVFYRPAADARYEHIDSLLGQPGENTINWRLIETHWPDLMQVALSIREGRLFSTLLLLRRLGTESRRTTSTRLGATPLGSGGERPKPGKSQAMTQNSPASPSMTGRHACQ
jgi:TnpA family transposase